MATAPRKPAAAIAPATKPVGFGAPALEAVVVEDVVPLPATVVDVVVAVVVGVGDVALLQPPV
jgi:hypothetical protein